MSRSRARTDIECWCCGHQAKHQARGLCKACYMRWRRRRFAGPGPGPAGWSPQAESAREHAGTLTGLSAQQAAWELGVTARTVHRWRKVLRTATPEWDGAPSYEVRSEMLAEFGGAA